MGRTIKATEEEIKAEARLTEALGLRDLQVVRQERDEIEERIILYCIPRYVVDVCRECGTVTSKIHAPSASPDTATVPPLPLHPIHIHVGATPTSPHSPADTPSCMRAQPTKAVRKK